MCANSQEAYRKYSIYIYQFNSCWNVCLSISDKADHLFLPYLCIGKKPWITNKYSSHTRYMRDIFQGESLGRLIEATCCHNPKVSYTTPPCAKNQ